jgi:SAM-dependent methyltransferase
MTQNPWIGDLDPAAAAQRAREYSSGFDRRAASGRDVHGEADLAERLIPAGGLVLDAGCGTGRVAARLTARGYRTVGVDLDGGMLTEARDRHPELEWVEGDLADLPVELRDHRFDAVIAAGNVMPLLTPGTEGAVIAALADALRPGGLLIAGFGLDDAHLPRAAPVNARFRSLAHYDAAAEAAGLLLVDRWSTWDRAGFSPDSGYAVSVHHS